MGLFDVATDLFSGNWGGLAGDFLEGFSGLGSTTVTPASFGPVYSVGQPMPEPMPVPVSDNRALARRAVGAGLPAWSARFPSLWQYLQTHMLGQGAVASLLTFLSKWGPTAMTAVVGANVVADLIQYKMTRKRRRMNPANTRALRRSLRRLKSFDRLASRVSRQLHRGGRRGYHRGARNVTVTGSRSVVND